MSVRRPLMSSCFSLMCAWQLGRNQHMIKEGWILYFSKYSFHLWDEGMEALWSFKMVVLSPASRKLTYKCNQERLCLCVQLAPSCDCQPGCQLVSKSVSVDTMCSLTHAFPLECVFGWALREIINSPQLKEISGLCVYSFKGWNLRWRIV